MGEAWLERAVDRALAAREAERRGLAVRDEVSSRLRALGAGAEKQREALLASALLAEVGARIAIGEAEARAYWSAHAHAFTQPRFVYRRIEAASREAAEVLARAAARPSDPEAVAGGDGSTREAAGVVDAARQTLGPFFRSEIPAVLAPEVFSLREPGERIVLERTGEIFVLELTELQLAAPLPFEAVRARIEARLRAQKAPAAYAALLARLRDEAEIEIDTDAVAAFVRSEGDAAAADPRAREALAFRAKLERLQAQRSAAADSRAPDSAPARP